jgi:HJR/Mrr/RecB family endonuclease
MEGIFIILCIVAAWRYVKTQREKDRLAVLNERREKNKRLRQWAEQAEQAEQERSQLAEQARLERLQLVEEQEKITLALEIKKGIEHLLGSNEFRKLLEGFVLNMSQDLFLDFEKLTYMDQLFMYYPTFRQFDEFVFFDSASERGVPFNWLWYHDRDKDRSTPFSKLFTILKSRVKFESDIHYSMSIWGAVKRVAISHFSEQFADEYRECHYLFKNGFEGVLITSYINPEVDTKALMMLSYYLLHNDTTQTKSLFKYYEEIIEKVTIEKNAKDLANFEDLLLTRNDKLSKVCTIKDVDMMDGYQFEEFVFVLFSRLGYVAKITKSSGDQGVDVVAEKGTMKIAIQAKCYSGNVPNSSVQQIVAGARHYNCNKKIVVTNSRFTPSAIELAHSNNVVLWDRDLLKEKLLEAQLLIQ